MSENESGEFVPVKVRILDRDYPLKVALGDEGFTTELAQHVDERMRAMRRALPTQSDLTHAVLTALELAEEMFSARAERDQYSERLDEEVTEMVERLTLALSGPVKSPVEA